MSVSEGTGGGRRRKADTELKTKTPHVNVGNFTIFISIVTFYMCSNFNDL